MSLWASSTSARFLLLAKVVGMVPVKLQQSQAFKGKQKICPSGQDEQRSFVLAMQGQLC